MGCAWSRIKRRHEVVQVSAEAKEHTDSPAQNDLPASKRNTAEEDELAASTRTSVYRGRRGSVSAEVKSFSDDSAQAKGLRKSLNTEDNIMGVLRHCFLFTELDDDQKRDVIGAMVKRDVVAGEIILREGEAGDNLYVIQSGVYEAIKGHGPGERVLFRYEDKGAFGELALMYNCPRAATVRAITDGTIWALDRSTFRTIVLASRVQKRARFEKVLEDMDIFQSLTPANRSSIADCLTLEEYREGDSILVEGEPLVTESKFYIIESGAVEFWKLFEGTKRMVGSMGPGRFFGEIALVRQNAGRAADCLAKQKTKVLTLSRDAFERLMGPAETILAEQVAQYERVNQGMSFSSNPRL